MILSANSWRALSSAFRSSRALISSASRSLCFLVQSLESRRPAISVPSAYASGAVQTGLPVLKGMKIGDVDPQVLTSCYLTVGASPAERTAAATEIRSGKAEQDTSARIALCWAYKKGWAAIGAGIGGMAVFVGANIGYVFGEFTFLIWFGIATIFVLNLTVSFNLALTVAPHPTLSEALAEAVRGMQGA